MAGAVAQTNQGQVGAVRGADGVDRALEVGPHGQVARRQAGEHAHRLADGGEQVAALRHHVDLGRLLQKQNNGGQG